MIASYSCLTNIHLCALTASYLNPIDLLNIDNLAKYWHQLVSGRIFQDLYYRHEDYDYLLYLSNAKTIRDIKQAVIKIYKRKMRKEDTIAFYGGYYAFTSPSYRCVLLHIQPQRITMSSTEAFDDDFDIGYQSSVLARNEVLYSFGGVSGENGYREQVLCNKVITDHLVFKIFNFQYANIRWRYNYHRWKR
jgi:hypothetical protein